MLFIHLTLENAAFHIFLERTLYIYQDSINEGECQQIMKSLSREFQSHLQIGLVRITAPHFIILKFIFQAEKYFKI